MKKFLLIAIAFFAFAACDDEDTSDLRDELKNQGDRLEMLENEMEALKLKIEGLNQTYKAVSEMLNGGLITNVEEVTGDDGKSGYKLTIQTVDDAGAQINTYTIWNGGDGKDGEDGENGTPGSAPQIGVEQEEGTGLYYWTLDGEPMLDASGEKLYATAQDGEQGEAGKPGTDGVTPQLKIEDNTWKISYDKGANWKDLGVFNGNVTSSNISVKVKDNNVVITQEGETDITFPIVQANTLGITLKESSKEINTAAGLRVLKDGVYLVDYELENASENAVVKAEVVNGTNFDVENLPAEKKFKITVKGQMTNDVILVHVYDGAMCMHTSFNITPDPTIKAITISEPELNFHLADISGNFEYTGELTLAEAATEDITLSVAPVGILAGAFTTEKVTISQGSTTGTYKVVVKRAALSAETSYIVPLVFSTEKSNYHVEGETEMTVMKTTTLQKIPLTGENYYASNVVGYAQGKRDLPNLCDDNLETLWQSTWNTPPAGQDGWYGDETYGIYVEVTLPVKMTFVQFKYQTRNSTNGLPKALALGVESSEGWICLGTENVSAGAAQWGETAQYSMEDKSSFETVRFGITKGFAPPSTTGPEDGDLTGLLGTEGAKINCVDLAELHVWGLY